MTELRARQWRFHPDRDRLLAEAHARPSTPLTAPMLATRIATLSGQDGAATDRTHMTALCRRLGQSEPSPDSKWCALDCGSWRLRWERHTEFSTWTFFRSPTRSDPFLETGLDLAPADWIDAMPGQVLVASNLALITRDKAPPEAFISGIDSIGATLLHGAARVFTDFRPDANAMTRFLLITDQHDPQLSGRLALSLLEIETYRLMALLAFPLAGEATTKLTQIEAEAGELASQLSYTAEAAEDRRLLGRLAELAGETEALSARTSFRFGAGTAYHDIVLDRIANLQEERIDGLQTLGEFMERRLAPAMRTCDTVARRQQAAIERIARTEQMLNTRVEVAAEATSAALLVSMDSRAQIQLRLQKAVEGFSVVAISYYVLSISAYALKALQHVHHGFDPVIAGGILAPFIVAAVWIAMRRFHKKVGND